MDKHYNVTVTPPVLSYSNLLFVLLPVLTPLPGTFGFSFIHILHHHIDKLLNNLTGWAQ